MMEKIYLLKILDENKKILVETMFANLNDAQELMTLELNSKNMSNEPIFKQSSIAFITILTQNQLKRQLNKGRKIY